MFLTLNAEYLAELGGPENFAGNLLKSSIGGVVISPYQLARVGNNLHPSHFTDLNVIANYDENRTDLGEQYPNYKHYFKLINDIKEGTGKNVPIIVQKHPRPGTTRSELVSDLKNTKGKIGKQ